MAASSACVIREPGNGVIQITRTPGSRAHVHLRQSLNAGRAAGFRVGLGAGAVWTATVGGVAGRGSCSSEGSRSAKPLTRWRVARPDDVAIAASLRDLVGHNAGFVRLSEQAFRVESLTAAPPAPTRTAPPAEDSSPALRAYVPRSAQGRVDAHQTDWLAEFRRGQPLKAHATWQLCLKAAKRLALPSETARTTKSAGVSRQRISTVRPA